ncbi:hypothetical protein cypCar_00018363, partial [Cyprinus carpio]
LFYISLTDSLFIIHPDVKEALADQRPVVALESTIITHGMPYPHNLSTAKEVEGIVRAEGAIPATVGILEGSIHVGLSSDELDFLAQSKMALKVSRRDLPYVISKLCDVKKASTLSLGLQSGLLLAIPIPEEHAATGQQIEDAIQTAVTEASSKGVTGRDVTPFILQRVSELTKGKSLQAIHSFSDIALIQNNAKVGSQIACALSKHKEKSGGNIRGDIKTRKSKDQRIDSNTIVIGGINVDFIAKGATKKLVFGQTNPGSVCQSFGGVGRNIADCLSRLGHKPLFISAIGKDSHSDAVLNYCKHMVSQFEDQLASASLVVLDGNIPLSTIDYVCCIAKKHAVPVWFEPTDADKACKPFLSESWRALSYTSPNLAELCTMNHTLGLPTPTEDPFKGRLCAVHYPALAVSSKETVNVSGAGDSFAGAMMVGILQGLDTDSCVRMGLLAARTSLLSPHPIDPSLTADAIHLEKSHSQLWSKPSFVWIED